MHPPLGALSVLVLAFSVTLLPAQTIYPAKIGGGPVPDGDVSEVTITPDGTRAVFLAQPDLPNPAGVFSAPTEGGVPIRLSSPGQLVFSYRVSPDSSTVVYSARDDQNRQQLYRVPVGGGEPVQLSQNTASSAVVVQFDFSPDGTNLVYVAEGDTFLLFELYSVPVAGGAVTKLNPPLVSGGRVINFLLSELFDRVIYLADQDTDTVNELYSVPITGGAAVKVNGALPAGGLVRSYELTPSGSFAVYVADQTTAGVLELYSASAQGGLGSSRRSGIMTAGGNVSSFAIAPNGGGIVYRADQDEDGKVELYATAISGFSSSVKLNGPLVADGDVSSFAIDSVNQRVVYRADAEVDFREDLYSVSNNGTGLVKLNAPATRVEDYGISPDAGTVAFVAGGEFSIIRDLFAVPIAGGAITQLTAPLDLNERVEGLVISPDSSRVVYWADELTDNMVELFSVPIDGSSAAVRLNEDFIPEGDVTFASNTDPAFFTPDSSRVLYLADQRFDAATELFGVPATGGVVAALSPPPGLDGEITNFQLSPDGNLVVYLANQESAGRLDLYVVPSRGGEAVRLTANVPSFASYSSPTFDPAGARIYFRADAEVDNKFELFSVSVSGGPFTRINAAFSSSSDVSGFVLSPDGSQVAYVASQDVPGVFELYVVPSDLSAAPVKVSGPLVSGGDVSSSALTFSPDGSRIVFRADKETNGLIELFSAPTDGSAPAVKLNGPAIPQADSIPFRYEITPDGSRVIYLWDQETDEQTELYSVPITGGTVTKLNLPLPAAGSDVRSFWVAGTGERVVFNADQDTAGQVELYSIPVDGSEPPIKLNGPMLTPNVDVLLFDLTPDGRTVLFVAAQADASGLFVVPVDGRSAPVSLNEPGVTSESTVGLAVGPNGAYAAISTTNPERAIYSVALADGTRTRLTQEFSNPSPFVRNLVIDSLGKRVVYEVDAEVDNHHELYSVPLRGGSEVRVSALDRLDARLDGVPGFQVAPGGAPVVYEADQRIPGVFELFAGGAQAVWDSAAGDWEDSGNWQGGVLPDESLEAVVAVDGVARLPGASAGAVVDALQLGGSGGSSILEFAGGAGLTVCNGAVLYPGGVIRGDGSFVLGAAALGIPAGAELRSATGDSLLVQSGPVQNAGRIEAVGTGLQQAELELTGPTLNKAGTGALIGRDAVFRLPGGLVNEGSLSFGSGVNDFVGAITNESGGIIVVSGGALAIFNDDVVNNGAINVSSSGGLSSSAVFFGAFSGNGVGGTGAVFLEGDTRPGFSPGTMAFGGDLSYGAFATLEVEIGGTVAGAEYDTVTVAGHLSLNGALEVVLVDGFVPEAGMVFDLWEAQSVEGAFSSVALPVLPHGLFWNTCLLNSTGELFVSTIPESYTAFSAFYGLSSLPGEDEDGDGILNVLEYLTGTSPVVFDAGPVIKIGDSEISFVAGSPPAKDLLVEIERSQNLQDAGPGSWEVIAARNGSDAWAGSETVTLSPAGPGLEQMAVGVPNGPGGRQFYRLRVTIVP